MNKDDLIGDWLTSDDQPLVDSRVFEDDPELARAVAVWEAMCAHIQAQQQMDLPDTDAVVLCALDAAGHGADLTAKERDMVADAQPNMDAAIETHLGLRDIVTDIGRDRNEWVALWGAAEGPHIRRIWPAVWRIAAVIAVVGLVGVLTWRLMQQPDNYTVVTVAESDVRTIALADGSTLHLVGPGEVRYNSVEFDRVVELTGGGFFEVVPQSEIFVVHTDEAVTSVLGTRFGVLDKDGVTEVMVESGSVRVGSESVPDQGVTLTPGQMSRVATGMAPTPPSSEDIAAALGWTGWLFLRSTPMSDVADLLSERFGVAVSVDASLATELVTGSFAPDESVGHVLNVLAITLEANVDSAATGWHVAPR